MHALFWIAIAIAIGVFFPAVGAFLLHPVGVVITVLLLVGLVASADDAVE